jgi:hypothetical protein
MATKNQWLKTNIKDRLTNPSADFAVYHNVSNINCSTFMDECLAAREDIIKTYPKLFVPLSGGLDSEFVMKLFLNDATPIIVDTPGNTIESAFAYRFCRVNNLTPIVIKKTEAEMLELYYNEIFKKLNGRGHNSVAVFIAAKYAVDNGGVAIIGEHAYDDVNEWDFYNDVLIGDDSSLYFFMWTPELVKAMQTEWNQFNEDHQEFKHKLYDLSYRPKISYYYSGKYNEVCKRILSTTVFPNSNATVKLL